MTRACALLGALVPASALAHEEPSVEAEPVTVTVSGPPREPAVASTALVNAREFQSAPRRSAEDALRLVPGVLLVQHGSEGKGHQLLVRGFDAAHGADFEISVEGIPLNEWSNVHAQGYLDLGLVIPEVVSSVRVTKGPFTLGQGAFAMAGSAAYHLGVEPEDRGLRIAYTLGSTNRHRALLTYSPPTGGGHDFIASETVHDDGFGQRRRANKGALLAKTELMRSSHGGTLSLLTGAHAARFELPGALRADDLEAGRVAFADSYTDSSQGTSLRALLGLGYEHQSARQALRGNVHLGLRRLEVFENFTGYLYEPRDGDYRLQRQDAFSFGASLAQSSRFTEHWSSNLGLGVVADVLEQERANADAVGRPLTARSALETFQALPYAFGGFVWQPDGALRLDAGARLDVPFVSVTNSAGDANRDQAANSDALVAASPRVVLQWEALPSLRATAAYGRGFRPPEARAFGGQISERAEQTSPLYTGGDARITTSDAFELGVRYRRASVSAQLSGFLTLIARESVYDHVSGVNLELNGTRRLGSELALRFSATEFLSLHADATLVHARFVNSDNPVPLVPSASGNARVELGRELGARGAVRLLAVLPRPLPNGATSSTFARLDVTAGYHWATWRLDLEVENVLDQRLREGEYHYASHWARDATPSSLPVLHYVAASPLEGRLTVTALF